MRHAVAREESACRVATRLATRLNHTHQMGLSESPSETRLVERALIKCSQRVAEGRDQVRTAEDMVNQQRMILAMLYPRHGTLDPVLKTLAHSRRRMQTLRRAIRDQSLALGKLDDAGNLLLLIADHVELLNSCYVNSCTSSVASDWSSDEEAVRVGCLGRGEELRSMVYLSSVPGNYRIRYLRKCWGYAGEALAAAVDLSSYLSVQLEREGRRELVPGIEVQARPTMGLIEFPGGLTFIFRGDILQKMGAEAKRMREVVLGWQRKQRKFVGRIRRDLSRMRKKAALQEAKLEELRQVLLSEEFADAYADGSPSSDGALAREAVWKEVSE